MITINVCQRTIFFKQPMFNDLLLEGCLVFVPIKLAYLYSRKWSRLATPVLAEPQKKRQPCQPSLGNRLQWTPLSLSGQWEVICTWQELSALSVKLHWVALNPKWTFESGKYNTIHS